MSREMKDSGVEWIGKIPNNWKLVPHKYIFKYVKGKKVDTKDTKEKDYLPYITMGVQRGTDEPLWGDKKQGIKVKKNDICILWDGANAGEFYKSISDGLLSSTSAALKVLAEKNSKEIIRYPKVYNQYLYYYLKVYETDLKNHTIGMGIPHVNGGKLRNDNMVIPGIEEQFKIANFLDEKTSEIDNIVEKTKQSIEELKAYKQSLITETVTKGLNPDVPMKDSGIEWIGSVPKHWDIVRLKQLFYEVNTRNIDDENAELLSLFTSIGVRPRKEMEQKGNKSQTVINYKIVEKNDLVVNKLLAWMGAIDFSDYDGVTSPDYDVYKVRASPKVVTEFYRNYFRYTEFKDDCYKYGRGIMLMRWRTYSKDFLNIPVVNPPKEEQQKIVKFLHTNILEVDNLINKKQQVIEELESYKQSLIYEYVTGKKEVK